MSVLKAMVRCLGLGPIARWLRSLGWILFDAGGRCLFFLLRSSGILPKPGVFDPGRVKSILVIRCDRIGDLILSVPAIRAVRRTFPRARLDVLVSAYTEPLLRRLDIVDRVLVMEKCLPSADYDLAIALHPGLRQNRLAFISGARWRAGYSGSGGSFFLTHAAKDDRSVRLRHEVESALEIVALLGCHTDDTGLSVSVSEEAESFAGEFFRERDLTAPVVIIHPGSRQPYLRWGKERFAQVADSLIEDDRLHVLILAGPGEEEAAYGVAACMRQRAGIVRGLELPQLVAIIKRSVLFIGNSTGPMHIAAALGVAVVAIFGCKHPLDSPAAWRPWSANSTVVAKEAPCRSCHPTECKTYSCMDLVSVAEVLEAARRLLRRA